MKTLANRLGDEMDEGGSNMTDLRKAVNNQLPIVVLLTLSRELDDPLQDQIEPLEDHAQIDLDISRQMATGNSP